MKATDDLEIPLDLPWYRAPFFERLIVLVLPPLGLWLIWRDPYRGVWRKLLAAVLTVLWLAPYAAIIIGLLTLSGVIALEFQGGFGPSIVRVKAEPNYAVLEDSRREQKEEQRPAAVATNQLSLLPPYWTDFRGPRRDGRYDERPLLLDWPADGPPRLWRQPCGGGYASFVVARGIAYTIEQRREQEAVVAYDLDTGRELWAHAYDALFTEWMGGDGPRATPTYYKDLIYSLGATGELCCLSANTGTALWQKNLLADTGARNLRWGLACSPLILDHAVMVLGGNGTDNQGVVAYDTLSGRKLWSVLSDNLAYTSPMFVTLAGQAQLLVVTAQRALGLDPDSRRILWEFPWQVPYDNAIAVPVLTGTNRFLLSAGYGVGAALVEVKRNGEQFVAEAVWRNRNLKTKFNAAVYWDGYLYGLDEGVLACIDATTGERVWRDGRYGYGQLLVAEGNLIVLGGDGQLALVEASPRGWFEKCQVQALRGKTWNVPALANGRLLVRNAVEMTCFDLRRRRTDVPPAASSAPALTPPPARPGAP